jgi:prepilin-type N-terminal cleavage/methylation domain-containing protein
MKRRGFTIAELLLVVLIIGLIAGAGTGLYVGSFRNMQVKKAALDFMLMAQYARLMAMERQAPYTMVLDPNNLGFSLTTLQWDQTNQQEALETIRDMYCKPVQLEGGVKLEVVDVMPGLSGTETSSPDSQTIAFSPNGTAQAAVVQIGDGKTHYTVSINAATGRAKLYSGTTENVKVLTTDLDEQS